MVIVFFDAKDYDHIWFDELAKGVDGEAFYVEKSLRAVMEGDMYIHELPIRFDVCCVNKETKFSDEEMAFLKKYSVKFVLVRDEDLVTSKEVAEADGINIMFIPVYTPREAAKMQMAGIFAMIYGFKGALSSLRPSVIMNTNEPLY